MKSELVMEVFLVSLLAGLVATAAMTLAELPYWRLWKLTGVFEWHENQVLISKFFRLDVKRLNFPGIFLLHFINGGLGGIGLSHYGAALSLVQEKFQQLILQGLQRYHLRQSIKLIFVMLSKQKLYRKEELK